MEWLTIIESFGFPVACVVALAWFVWIKDQQAVEREKVLMDLIHEQNTKFDIQSEQLQAIALTQERIIDRLEKLERGEAA